MTQYLDAAYELLIEKAGSRPSFVVLVCAAHVLNRCKKFFTGNSRKETKDLAMKIMGRMIMSDPVEQIITSKSFSLKAKKLRLNYQQNG